MLMNLKVARMKAGLKKWLSQFPGDTRYSTIAVNMLDITKGGKESMNIVRIRNYLVRNNMHQYQLAKQLDRFCRGVEISRSDSHFLTRKGLNKQVGE